MISCRSSTGRAPRWAPAGSVARRVTSAGVLPLLPNPGTVVTHVVGRAVDVGGAARVPGAPVTEAELEEAYRRYKAELSRVFEKHKHALLPPEVAARGLLFHRL